MSGGSSTEPKHDDARAPNPAPAGGYWRAVRLWFDAGAAQPGTGADGAADRIEWARILPFIGMHVACLAVYWVGASRIAIGTAAVLYAARMVAITGFYHRYFSLRTFKTSRVGQFVFGVLGASAVQRGPLWWAAHHRHHHAYSDRPEDLHSPRQRGFLWSHMGWFVSKRGFVPDYARVKDLLRYPELRLLDRFDILVPVAFAVGLFVAGAVLGHHYPSLHTSGAQLLVWGFFISTVVCYHATYTINSLSHVFGWRRYDTGDDSRNNPLLALLTFGEGWHNNHHHYPSSARQGFYWWEVDLTYYCLRILAALGIIWDLKPIPASVRATRTRRSLQARGTPRG